MPNIQIVFQEAAIATIQKGTRGVVALIIKDTVLNNTTLTLNSIADMPLTLSVYNQNQITLAFMGNVNPPLQVIVFVQASASVDYSTGMTALATIKWDYLAVPGAGATDVTTIAIWVKSLRDTFGKKVKFIAPNYVANHEGVIDSATTSFVVGVTTYATTDYCSRIAGLIAGTPLSMSATYAILPEVTDVLPHLTKTALDAAVTAGQLVFVKDDAGQCKIYEAINSLTTTNAIKGADYQKIKIVDIMDQIVTDVNMTIANNYVGKYPNSYIYKAMLIVAIKAYFSGLESSELLDSGTSVGIDINANTLYLQGIGTVTTNMTVQQIKEANTGSNVNIVASIKILDAMENYNFNISI